MKKKIIFTLMLLACLVINGISYADQSVIAEKIDLPPVIDGNADEPLWEKPQAIVTHDNITGIDITMKAAYTDKEIFFLVTFPDPDESRKHKYWVWDKHEEMYKVGMLREDTFIFKWNMEAYPVDLSVYSDESYMADIWFWKANRTDPVGFADDKMQKLGKTKRSKSIEVTTKTGNIMYLERLGDSGTTAYKDVLFIEYEGDEIPNYENRTPSGSRADIKAKGIWSDGRWTMEFSRFLNTGNPDDIQFVPGKSYQFGVSSQEMAARQHDPELSQPFYGAGDVGEMLTLEWGE
ncbi:ethylbenzene dehydrogenase-related protein [Candidatus Omnitrophota bacterium]